ncbi:hypothetical protein [Enterocloster bolteae]|uniref:hypothetical protein n=1 Tax=Enterocloster bolteae TaxID=208479 RepID=UPI000E48C9C7|nr:hypothetical protein [Enterocloster bolteae]RGS06874.1 hypothetical protein DWY12_20695 [Enterocloster bolteae]
MAAPEGYTKLGNVGYADKGVYSADATYNKYNTVYHEGSTYVALKDNLHGVTPADGANWRYMAKGFTEASADAITVIDTSGIIDGTKNKKTILQTFLDKVGDFIINKAVTNDALMLKLADYVAKTDIVQVESTATNKVPSSAYLKQVKDSIDSNLVNLPKIIECGNTTFTKINANTYADINITFTKVFDSTPSIQLTDGSKSESVKYGSMSPSAINITSKGFTIRYYNNTDYTPAPYVMWTAIL